jgi:hypothetical protein
LALTKRVFSKREGKLDRSFESFARNEANGLRSLDFDLRAGLWIHSGAGLAVADFEGAEANKLDILIFINVGIQTIHNFFLIIILLILCQFNFILLKVLRLKKLLALNIAIEILILIHF